MAPDGLSMSPSIRLSLALVVLLLTGCPARKPVETEAAPQLPDPLQMVGCLKRLPAYPNLESVDRVDGMSLFAGCAALEGLELQQPVAALLTGKGLPRCIAPGRKDDGAYAACVGEREGAIREAAHSIDVDTPAELRVLALCAIGSGLNRGFLRSVRAQTLAEVATIDAESWNCHANPKDAALGSCVEPPASLLSSIAASCTRPQPVQSPEWRELFRWTFGVLVQDLQEAE